MYTAALLLLSGEGVRLRSPPHAMMGQESCCALAKARERPIAESVGVTVAEVVIISCVAVSGSGIGGAGAWLLAASTREAGGDRHTAVDLGFLSGVNGVGVSVLGGGDVVKVSVTGRCERPSRARETAQAAELLRDADTSAGSMVIKHIGPGGASGSLAGILPFPSSKSLMAALRLAACTVQHCADV